MRLAIAALGAAMLLTGTASRAQDAAGTVENKAAAGAEQTDTSVQSPVRPAEPKPRNLLLDVLNQLIGPQGSPTAAPAPATAEPVPAPVATAPTPAGPGAATGATAAPSIPRAVAAQPSPAPSRPGAGVEPPGRVEPTAEPAAANPARPGEPDPRPAAVSDFAAGAEEASAAEPVDGPARPTAGAALWVLLGLLAAAAIAASAVRVRRTRRIARTRAALALEPRLDASAGASSLSGLSFACPPLAIRARLDFGEAPSG